MTTFSQVLHISTYGDSQATCFNVWPLSQLKGVFLCSDGITCTLICLLSCHLALPFIFSLCHWVFILTRSSLKLTFSRLTSPSSQALLIRQMLQSYISFINLCWTCSSVLCLSCAGKVRTVQMCPHQCWVEGKNHLPWPAFNIYPNAAQVSTGPLYLKGALLTHVQLAVIEDPKVLCWAAFQSVSNFPVSPGPSRWGHSHLVYLPLFPVLYQ